MTTIGTPVHRLALPLTGARNPGRTPGVTTPGSFANAPDIGGPLMFSSPDTPGMPPASDKTAWDFLPEDWSTEILSDLDPSVPHPSVPSSSPCYACESHTFREA